MSWATTTVAPVFHLSKQQWSVTAFIIALAISLALLTIVVVAPLRKYPYSAAIDAIKNYINLKQIEDESLVDYTRRFKLAKKVMETQIGGKLQLPKLAKLDLKWMEISNPANWTVDRQTARHEPTRGSQHTSIWRTRIEPSMGHFYLD